MSREVATWDLDSEESITSRLVAAQVVQDRVRLATVVTAIVSAMIAVAIYNAYFGFDYDWALEKVRAKATFGSATTDEILNAQSLRTWADSRHVHVSLLGIRLCVDDAALIGTVALLIAAYWLMLATHRENHTLGFLLRDTSPPEGTKEADTRLQRCRRVRWLVFHSLVSAASFFTVGTSEYRFHRLETIRPTKRELYRSSIRGYRKTFAEAFAYRIGRTADWLNSARFFLPCVVAAFAFWADLRSYKTPDPFEPDGGLPDHLPFLEIETLVFWPLAALLLVVCVRSCLFHLGTKRMIAAYFEDIELREQGRAPRTIDISCG